MPGRKKDEAFEAFDYDEARKKLTEDMTNLHISRAHEMPHIELYRDQVLSLVSSELAPLYADDEKIITGSMVNNYVKQRLVTAPSRKRYSSEHLMYLIVVCTIKRVLPIAQVTQLIELCRQADFDIVSTYDAIIDCLEADLKARFSDTDPADIPPVSQLHLTDTHGNPVEGMIPALLQASISLVANKVYVERLLELEVRKASLAPEDPVIGILS